MLHRLHGAFAILAVTVAAWLQGCGGDMAAQLCMMLKVTADVSAMVESFCSGDLSPILDQFDQVFMGLVSDVSGTACETLGDFSNDRFLEICKEMAQAADSKLLLDVCTDKSQDVTDKMVAECIRQAEAQAQKWIDDAEDAAKKKVRKAYKKKLTRKSQKKAKVIKNQACAAAPVVAGIASTLHEGNCIEVVADVYIGCAEVTNHPAYQMDTTLQSFLEKIGTSASTYGFSANPLTSMGQLWFWSWASNAIYLNQKDIAPYNDPVITQLVSQIGKTKAGIALMAASSQDYESALLEAYVDSAVSSKLTELKLWKRGATNPTFCDFTFTTTLSAELTMEQIIGKANTSARVGNIFYSADMTEDEWSKFLVDTAKACKDHTGYSTWLQMSDQYEEPLKVYQCASNIVTYERDLSSWGVNNAHTVSLHALIVAVVLLGVHVTGMLVHV